MYVYLLGQCYIQPPPPPPPSHPSHKFSLVILSTFCLLRTTLNGFIIKALLTYWCIDILALHYTFPIHQCSYCVYVEKKLYTSVISNIMFEKKNQKETNLMAFENISKRDYS